MISSFRTVWFYVFGPRLYKIHGDGPLHNYYIPNTLEKWGDRILLSLHIMWKVAVYTSPLITYYFYRKNYLTLNSVTPLLKMLAGVGFVVVVSLCMRAYGRVTSPKYRDFASFFVQRIHISKSNPTSFWNNCDSVRHYDFDFDWWPVDWNSKWVGETKGIQYCKSSNRTYTWRSIPLYILGEIATRSFALKFIYPGSVSILQMAVSKYLLEGRIKLVEQHNGRRYKVHTRNGNDIDCMFVDKRMTIPNGKILVITSEGNAGFYEIGIMSTPLEAGYSVLGWNHPGFAGSSGQPYPLQERYAMDAIIQFAIRKLGFLPENIVLFGWSIGCYSVAWAATQYPDIRGVVLDATFDDLMPLAVARMPASWATLVEEVVRGHVDLNIAEILKSYSGPIKFIRRTMDEIICIEEGNLSTNRGNDLILKTLSHRYPYLFEQEQVQLLREYLGKPGPALNAFSSMDHPGYFLDSNEEVMYLISKYLIDYQSTHCNPLPADYFEVPRKVTLHEDFI